MKDINSSFKLPVMNLAGMSFQSQCYVEKDIEGATINGLFQPEIVVNNSECRTEKTKLIIKNMKCVRCTMVVKSILESLKIPYNYVNLGEVGVSGALSDEKHTQLKEMLLKFDFDLVENPRKLLVEKINKIIFEFFFDEEEPPKIKFSHYLSERLNHNYAHLSKIFSQVMGISIEHFILLNKIERAKEMLLKGEITLTEIAMRLHYSSVAHLSNQFKQFTGLTPSRFTAISQK